MSQNNFIRSKFRCIQLTKLRVTPRIIVLYIYATPHECLDLDVLIVHLVNERALVLALLVHHWTLVHVQTIHRLVH